MEKVPVLKKISLQTHFLYLHTFLITKTLFTLNDTIKIAKIICLQFH